MAKEMLINFSEGEECRIAVVEGGKLEELYMERTSSTSHVNNIYKGRVMNVEPSIQAAFIDFGLSRNGFLHISDLMPTYFGQKGEDVQESVGRKMARRDRPPIQRCLRRGDEVLVQVIKEGIGTKGPTLSTYLSIPGKILVMMPGMASKGVSRKIEDDDERRRLRQILDQLDPPDDVGFIIRTAGVGKSKAEIERDLKYLVRLWETIKKKRDGRAGPVELYTEGDLITRTVRDLFSDDVDRVIIDNAEVARQVKEVIKLANPRARNRVDLYDGPIPLFHKYGIEKEIEQMYSRHVPLPSGGGLVIDSTEAIVAIDVNSGKFRDHSDAETTAYKTDMEAADEICRQLKLRDLGGVIICDFIDLRYERHRNDLERRLHENLKSDRAKTKFLRMSQFGIVEMTRQRMRPSLKRGAYLDCPHCKGAGLVKSPESMSLDVMRRLAIGVNDTKVVRVELSVNPEVAFYLLNKKRGQLAWLESENKKQILVKSDAALGLDEMKFDLYDNRDGLVVIADLAGSGAPHAAHTRTAQAPQRGRPGAAKPTGDRRPGQRPPQPQSGGRRPAEERNDWDRSAEDIEDGDRDFDRDAEESADRSPQVAAGNRPPARPHSQPPAHSRPHADSRQANQESGRPPFEASRGPRQVDARNGQDRNGANGPEVDQNGEALSDEEGGPRRRRRRRRRRGRGRGGQQADQTGQGVAPPLGQADERPFDDDEASDPNTHQAAHFDEERADEVGTGRHDEAESHFDDDAQGAPGEPYEPSEERGSFDARPRDGGRDEREDQEEREPAGREAFAEAGGLESNRDEGGEDAAFEELPAGQPIAPSGAEARAEEVPAPGRKPRRRGGRGRGRGRKSDAALVQEEQPPLPAQAEAPEQDEPAEALSPALLPDADEPASPAAKPKRRRTASAAPKKAAATGRARKGKAAGASAAAPRASKASAKTPAAESAAPVARTGSADRHLADDEPVHHEPVRHPRNYRDLDQIPDDFD